MDYSGLCDKLPDNCLLSPHAYILPGIRNVNKMGKSDMNYQVIRAKEFSGMRG
jgi:hypothetical protein